MTSVNSRNPFELVNLMALLKHNVGTYVALGKSAALIEFMAAMPLPQSEPGRPFVPPDPNRPFIPPTDGKLAVNMKAAFTALLSEPAVVETPFLIKQIDRVLSLMEKSSSSELTTAIKNLYVRMDDLFAGQTFYVVSPDKVKHYEEPFSEWGSVPSSIHSAMDAIEEAEKCFALGRNTACVFHCMAIMDRGLAALGKHLRTGINPDTDTWETIIGNIQGAINRKRSSMDKAAWKAVEPFYEEALSDLRAVKNAWRNPTMHFRRVYTEEQAAKVRERVREFMVHLCVRVHERKRKEI